MENLQVNIYTQFTIKIIDQACWQLAAYGGSYVKFVPVSLV